MKIELIKFGATLTSRQAGREAYAALQPLLNNVLADEMIEMDFHGVVTFSPSWGDEVITPLRKSFGDRLQMAHTDNPSVIATLELLESIEDEAEPRVSSSESEAGHQ